MSELKAYGIREIDGLVVESESGQLCLKSEADKVIAELEESHKKEVEQLLMEIVELKDHNENYRFDNKEMLHKITKQDAELRHHKYKRCLAMAKMCGIMSAFEDGEWYTKWINKWHKRWCELAEKFKEDK